MKKRIAIVLGSAALMFAATSKQTFTGVITDSMCGGNHKSMNMGPDEKCVPACVRAGSKYALWDGKKVYILSDQKTPEKFAAKKVKVTGSLSAKGDSIQVDSIEAAK
jgi:hypothetical protein